MWPEYEILTEPASAIAVFCFLAAFVSIWVGEDRRVPLAWWIGFLLSAGVAGRIEPPAWSYILILHAAAWVASHRRNPTVRTGAQLTLLVLCPWIADHRVDGFHSWKLFSDVTFSVGAVPYSLWFHFDKPILGFVLLFWGTRLCKTSADWKSVGRTWRWIAPRMIALVVAAALAMHYIDVDLDFPPLGLPWMFLNLFGTCVAEEAFFRGFLQRQLDLRIGHTRAGNAFSLVLVSILFGLAHFAGGVRYVLLASLAGMFYGTAYRRAGQIESAILTHFSLNCVHFFFFTYPHLA